MVMNLLPLLYEREIIATIFQFVVWQNIVWSSTSLAKYSHLQFQYAVDIT